MAGSRAGDRLTRDISNYALKIYRSDTSDPSCQRLPKCWNMKDRSRALKLTQFSLTVTHSGGYSDRHDSSYGSQDGAALRADTYIPLTTGIYYFEVTLSNKCNNGRSVSVGVATKSSNLSKLPGLEHSSFGYHSDGSIYHGSANSAVEFGPRLTDNDTVGCGVDIMSRSLFFTRNGVFLGKAFEGQIPASPGSRLYPTVGLQGRGTRVTVNFGQRPFNYAFEKHIKRERLSRESQLIEKECSEDFAGPKMMELVSGYLVHHGYVATAQSMSRWASIPLVPKSSDSKSNVSFLPVTVSQTPTHEQKSFDAMSAVQSRSCESHIGSYKTKSGLVSESICRLDAVPRRHSDSSFLLTPNSTSLAQLPGITSMLHRRRLRALCRRCQYGKAAATLNSLYPQVLERCPELLVQLRCRQLIEMMRRHAVRRDRSTAFDSESGSNPSSDPAPPKVKKTHDSQHVRSGCCIGDSVATRGSPLLPNSPAPDLNESRHVAVGAMDVDTDDSKLTSENSNLIVTEGSSPVSVDLEDDIGDADDDEDDVDDFGINDDTGVSLDSIFNATVSENHSSAPEGMEVDSDSTPVASVTSNPLAVFDGLNELPCLLRQIQFGRSLVNLVKKVRSKTGGLTLETERLLQQSVSLLAYSTPTSKDCPLNNLLDPVWRDVIANVINSAVLKAHDLPVQPALEQGLRALRRCFQDPYFLEAQTLGHFLLYHLTPSRLDELDRAASALDKKHSAGSSGTTAMDSAGNTAPKDNSTSCSSKRFVSNGHVSGRRRRGEKRLANNGESENPNIYETEDCSSSSLDEVFDKDDEGLDDDEDEDDEDEEDGERCHVDEDIGAHQDDDDDDEHDSNITDSSRRRTRDFPSSDSRGSSNLSSDRRSPNDEPSSGRMHSIGYRARHIPTSLRSPFSSGTSNVRPTRHAVFARYCPAIIIDQPRSRILAAMPSTTSAVRRSTARASPVSADASLVRPLSPVHHTLPTRQSTNEVPPNQYLDSAFSGLLSMAYPQHTELLSAMNDALKVYAGSLFTTEDDLSGPSNERRSRDQHPRPPPTGGACAP